MLDMRAFGIVLTILLSVCSPTRAQTKGEIADLNQQIFRLYQAGEYAKATLIVQKALELSEKKFGPGHANVGTILNNLAELYKIQGRHAEAEPLLKRSLSIRKKALGSDHPHVGRSLNSLADLYESQSRHAEAEPLLKQSIKIVEKSLGSNHPNVGILLNNLAEIHKTQGKYAEAEPLLKRSINIVVKALGPGHPNVGVSLSNLANIYKLQGWYAKAEPLYKRSINIIKKALGSDHPDLGTSLNNLAGLYYSQGRYAEAEPLYKRSITIYEKALGSKHLYVGQALTNLADTYKLQGRYTEAEPLYKRSIIIIKKSLRPNHPNVGTALDNLAELYKLQGRHAEAEPLLKRSLSIVEKALGLDHPEVGQLLNSLAVLYHNQSRYTEVDPLLKRSINIIEKALGPDHPNVGTTLNNQASVYLSQGRYTEAEPLYKRSLLIREKALGSDHIDVGQSLNNLAVLYRLQGKYADAEPLYKRSLSIREKALGLDHPNVGTTLSNLARLYQETAQTDEEKKVRKRLALMPPSGTRHIPIYFATTRIHSGGNELYGGSDSDTTYFGRVIMQIPAEIIEQQGRERANMLGRLDRRRTDLSGAKFFKRVRHRTLNLNQAAESIEAFLSRTALFKNQALIFIHGFNVNFNEATQRISQIAFDLEFDGALVAFSWASLGRGDPIAYKSDRGRADRSVQRFTALLDQLSERFPNLKLHIIAHSMGNRILTRALHQIAQRPRYAKRPNIGEIILAHADVDPEWCKKLGKARPFVRGITNYVNRDDWALLAAKAFRLGKGRCGRLPRVYKGIETIDTTGMGGRGSVKTLISGKNHHGVFANDPLLFGEITRLIAAGQRPPEDRTPELAQRKDKNGAIYWAYDKSKDVVIITQTAK